MPVIKHDKIRHLLVYLIFLVAAFSLWLLKALNEEYDSYISVKVEVVGLPEGVELDLQEELMIEANVYGLGTSLVEYEFGEPVTVTVYYSDFNDNDGALSLPLSTLKNRIGNALGPMSLSLQHFREDSLKVNIRKRCRNLLAETAVDVKPAEHYEIKKIDIEPANVQVTAPPSFFVGRKSIEYNPVMCHGLMKDTTFVVDTLGSQVFKNGKYVDIATLQLCIHVDVEPLCVCTVKIPLERVNFPANKIKSFNAGYIYNIPDSVIVGYEISEDSLGVAPRGAFRAKVDYNNIAISGKGCTIPVVLDSFPGCVDPRSVTIEPSVLELIPSNVGNIFQFPIDFNLSFQ